ncbi:MAG: ribonuclease III family protein [candidate division NC10 bacterium]|nr:ribonuclease III family protein [candidate division NC10 bacterium]
MEHPRDSAVPLDAAIMSFQALLEYRFRDPSLLRQALGTWNLPLSPEAAAARQRLEFLGDAAWDFAVAAAAFELWPQATAGDLTRFRSVWCSTTGLAHLARQIGLPLPQSLAAPAPSDRVLAEMLEAVLGAMVQDGGLDAVRALAHRGMAKERTVTTPPPVDPKSALQMLAQARFGTLPIYRLLERRGPAHQPRFRVGVRVSCAESEIRADAEGPSRQAAEQEAARLALHRLVEGTDS